MKFSNKITLSECFNIEEHEENCTQGRCNQKVHFCILYCVFKSDSNDTTSTNTNTNTNTNTKVSFLHFVFCVVEINSVLFELGY